MNRRLVPAVVAALAAAFLATALTAAADTTATAAVNAPGVTTTVVTTRPTTPTSPPKDRGVVVAVPRNAGASLSLVRGFPVRTVFSVSLYENPSTGYGWSQSVPAAATGPVTLLDTDYVADPAPPGTAGSGGTRYFRYLVTSRGATTVTFLYRRPWETGVPPLQQVTLTVHAR